ncbi:hypothetical protein [Nostoc sp. GT001]|uniref:hypothetical protein n=1 Tax=Nostoc sp. GT001 TaxID=3056647 RepID=UPI0025AA81A7|nr:hypothetical protein [Nostoc sp. GT001]MDM9584509.1 hypothetical protein [Nostoc sp. GT001]
MQNSLNLSKQTKCLAPNYCCIEGVRKILLNIGTRGRGLFAVILALVAEELLTTSERRGGLLLVELAKSVSFVAEGELEGMEVTFSGF